MGLTGKPRHGDSVRKYAETDGRSKSDAAERLHAVQTLRTLSGATIGSSARRSESRETALDSPATALGARRRIYAAACEIVFIDRAKDLDPGSTWGYFPNLIAIASDPTRRCMEPESCFGKSRNKMTETLRKCHAKFSPK